jgi:uncharacterized protein (TIGR03435 family)
MATLTLILSQQVGRTVVDKTGLSGRYDFTTEYALESAGRGRSEGGEPVQSPDGLPSIFAALQEQFGLKLESQKEPVEFLVSRSRREAIRKLASQVSDLSAWQSPPIISNVLGMALCLA